MHQKRTKDQIQGCTEAGDQTQTPVLPREDDIVSFYLALVSVSSSVILFLEGYICFLYLCLQPFLSFLLLLLLHLIFHSFLLLILYFIILPCSLDLFLPIFLSPLAFSSSYSPNFLLPAFLPVCTACIRTFVTHWDTLKDAVTVLWNTIKMLSSCTGIIKTSSRLCLEHLGGFTEWR